MTQNSLSYSIALYPANLRKDFFFWGGEKVQVALYTKFITKNSLYRKWDQCPFMQSAGGSYILTTPFFFQMKS